MQISITAEEVFAEYKMQLAELHHDLMLERIKNKKLVDYANQLEAEKAQSALRNLAATRESLPPVPAPPAVPEAPGDPSAAREA